MEKMQKLGVFKTFKKNLFQNFSIEFLVIAHKYGLGTCNKTRVHVIKVCPNGGPTYIIGKIIAKDNLNKTNLIPLKIFSKSKSSSPKLFNRILRYCTQIVVGSV